MPVLRLVPILLALLILLPPVHAAPADNRADALALLTLLKEEARREADRLQADLADSSVYLLRVNGNTIRVTDRQLDNLLAYMQLHALLDPAASAVLIAKAAGALGMPPEALSVVLEDPDSFAAMGTMALATARLRAEADKHKAAILREIAEWRAFADEVQRVTEKAAASPTWPPTGGGGGGTTISPVIDDGMTVDYCLSWATNCGQPAAEEFCRRQGYRGASAFTWTYMHPTRTLISREVCDADFCGGITSVTCYP